MAEIEQLPTRWEVELENKYLEDERFLNYLEYLEYWRRPEYCKYLVYPNCLHILTLLKNKEFRTQILRLDVAGNISNDMVNRWQEPQTVFAPTPIEKMNAETEETDGLTITTNDLANGKENDIPSAIESNGNGHLNGTIPQILTDVSESSANGS